MEFCEETVSIMMSNFIKRFRKKNDPSIVDIDIEIDNVKKTSISIKTLWQKISNTEEEVLMYEQNIADYAEYINRLEEFKTKYQKELEFINKLEKSFGKSGKEMMKVFMVNDDQSFTIDGDKLYMETKSEYSLVMTKEVFQECYKRWINPQEYICDRIESGTDGNPYKMWISGGTNSKDSDTE